MTGNEETYSKRVVDVELDDLLEGLPAVCVQGPRGVGKSTTAIRRANTVFELDNPAVLETVSADPSLMVQDQGTTLLDEWQRLPASWDLVRRAVDADGRPGRFLLTGSASPLNRPTHSGAGRIVTLRMRPLSLFERWWELVFGEPAVSLAALMAGSVPEVSGETSARLADYVRAITVGGFPGMPHEPGRSSRAALRGYVDRIIDTDFVEAGHRTRNPGALMRWLTAYAAATATSASYETIRDAATSGHDDKPSRGATGPYVDTLERLWLLDPVPAWQPTRNRLNKLTGRAKHHLADPALAASLLGTSAEMLLEAEDTDAPALREGSLLGHLFESLVALNLRVYAQACESSVGHFRKQGNSREIDFIVSRPDGRIVAIETKLSQTVSNKDVRHLHWLKEEIGPDLLDAMVITTGKWAYRRKDGIAVVPAALLGP